MDGYILATIIVLPGNRLEAVWPRLKEEQSSETGFGIIFLVLQYMYITALSTSGGYHAAFLDCVPEKYKILPKFRLSYVNEGVTGHNCFKPLFATV